MVGEYTFRERMNIYAGRVIGASIPIACIRYGLLPRLGAAMYYQDPQTEVMHWACSAFGALFFPNINHLLLDEGGIFERSIIGWGARKGDIIAKAEVKQLREEQLSRELLGEVLHDW